ncbi:RHS repeat-associated core domain-containing protein [Sorangium sp. So ce590]|uniref:RHS repeat-associated core domain-containing protein n=1 Tax=unclassified Sorangium TaxID=2621164 RepID=UPI003F61DE3B
MARTAPVPNIPAIPGMNPGVFILGGGGAGGGDNGRGGSGSGAGQGAGGNNGGNGANGGGPGANGCGPGSGGGCMNPAHGGNGGTHAGDPVDPVTGRVYTLPQTDLVLTGPMVFELRRSYSSFAREHDVGLGAGWTHSLAWEIALRRRTLVVHAPSGAASLRDIPPPGGEVALNSGGRLRRDENGFLVTGEDGLVYLFEPFAASRERHRLATIVDRAGNRVDLAYQGDLLESLRDSAGRTVRVRRYRDGRIEAFELVTARGRTVRCRTYAYDDRGDLVAATDAAGRSVRYAYDEHRLVEQASPSGLRVFYRYDGKGRCTETWCAHPGERDPALAEGSPTVLADGQTPARGMLHCRLEYADGFTMVYDSRQARRFDSNAFGKIDLAAGLWVEGAAYDARGDLVAYSDPTGARTLYERDAAGRVVAIVDPTGARIEHRHDPQGNVVEATDALGAACHYSYDDAANLLGVRDALGELLRFTYDERGLRITAVLPDGGVTLFRHDAEGNLIELVEPHGKPRRMEYDDVGRVLAVTDEEGHRTSFHYDERGALWGLRFPGGAEVAIERDEDGRITRYRGPDGAYDLAWGGYNLVHELRKPNGETIRFRYDRECQLVEVENERGEVHRIERDAAGRIVAERFFDGRELRYRLDAAGRVQHIRDAAAHTTEIERDPCGRVVRRGYADDTFDAFDYDPVGRLIHAETEATCCEFTYDQRGNLVREVQTCAGRRVVIESAYDAAGRRTALRTSTGHEARYERDRMGRARRVVTSGAAIERTYDTFGRELLRELPGGGRVLCRYDGVGALVERRVLGRSNAREAEPDWVGPLPPGTTYAEGFAHSPGGDLVEHVATGGERTRFEHDAAGRILAQLSTHTPAERFSHGGGGRLQEAGDDAPARRYGPGGVLLSRGDISYEHDAEARRTARVDRTTGERVRYAWSGRGLLAAVVLPDGTRAENVYDASARRLLKRVSRADGALLETHFVWSGDDLLQEITEEVVAGQRRVIRVRDYLWGEQGEGPLAHREHVPGGEPEVSRWVHYVLGAGGAPSLLLSDTGEVLARLRLRVWGALDTPPFGPAPTPWRYPGQYHDDETGLAYNRYRFYDAAVGLYLSPDPLGIAGGLNAFEYARGQPFRVVDPEGLTPVLCTVSGHGVRGRGASAAGRSSDPALHPVVVAAMPPPVDLRGEPFYPAERRSPETCAEPGALSEYIRNWERQNNNGRPLDPNNPRDRRRIQRCLGDITSIQAQHPDGTARAPCPNCSQLLQNLRDRWGAPRERVVQPGASSETGTDSLRSTPPDPRWAQGMRQQRRRERRR